MSSYTRRAALQTVTLAGVGVPFLAACTGTDSADAGSSTATKSIDKSSVPEGGGLIDGDAQVVYVQPTAGEFKAYSAICPHQKCLFTVVEENTIKCGGCHRSEFDASDGTNTVGPNDTAPSLPALAEVAITVDGDSITLGVS